MNLYELERRQQEQQPAPPGGGSAAENTGDTTLPTYIWVIVVLFIVLSATCGICARRRHQRQIMYRQAILNSQQSTLPYGRSPYAPPWTVFSRPPGDPATALQLPPRARRRGSQASVTSLPVYMENAGAKEVVLLQRTAPKDPSDTSATPLAQSPVIDTDTTPISATDSVVRPQPTSDATPRATDRTNDNAPPLPGYELSPIPLAVSSRPSEPSTAPPPHPS